MKTYVRILLALPLVVLAGLASPGALYAAPQSVLTTTLNEISCVFETAEGDLIFFQAGAGDEGSGSGAFIESAAGEFVGSGEGTATFGADFAADATVEGVSGSPIGTLSVRLTLTTPFEPVVEQIDARDGNVKTKGTMTITDYLVDVGAVTLGSFTVLPGADDCWGSRIAFDVRSNNPNHHVFSYEDMEADACFLEGIPNAFLGLQGQSIDEFGFRVIIEEDSQLRAQGDLTTRGGAKRRTAQATEPLVDQSTGDPVAELSLALTLTRIGQPMSQHFRGPHENTIVRWTSYDALVEVTTTDGRAGTVHCPVTSVTVTSNLAGSEH